MITEVRTQRTNRPILFLDFDDVLCLNVDGGYGGYDVMLALAEVEKGTKGLADFARLWTTLFDAQAKAHLRALHDEFSPTYVLSTSWTRLMDREALETTLREAGIGFVADNLHTAWETTKVGHFAIARFKPSTHIVATAWTYGSITGVVVSATDCSIWHLC